MGTHCSMSKRQRTEPLFSKLFTVVSKCPPAAAGVKLIGTHDGTFHCDVRHPDSNCGCKVHGR